MNRFAADLRAGQNKLGMVVTYPSPGVVERIGRDWDWVWIDAQHGQLDYHDVLALVRACDAMGTAPIVRVASNEYGAIGRALDTNATGVIVPMVDTAEEARQAVDAAKYAPAGKRSYGGRRVGDLRGRLYPKDANSDTLLIVQIETPRGLANVESIAAVPGVDALFYGPDDVLLGRGLPMDSPKTPATLGPDLQAIAVACANHGKIAVTLAFSAELIAHCFKLGYRMLNVGADIAFLTEGSKQALASARAIAAQGGGSPVISPKR